LAIWVLSCWLIRLMMVGAGLTFLTHKTILWMTMQCSTTRDIGHHVELRSGAIESQTDVYSVGEIFLMLEQIQM
jgi:hypothetical protein